MLNPKGKLAHVVRIVWFVAIFTIPFVLFTEDDVAAKCGGHPSGGPGFWASGNCYSESSWECPNGFWDPGVHDDCVVERCYCFGGIDRFYSYCANPRMACLKILSGCWNTSCDS